MKLEFFKHKLAYLTLFVGLGGLTLLFFAAWPDRTWQRLVVIGLAMYYFTWGIATHLKTEVLSRRVLYEYLGISLVGGVILFLVTL